jgi:hypothetical protein
VKVHQAGIRLPSLDNPAHASVVQRPRTSEPSSQSLLSAHIITGEHVQSPKASQEHVLGTPPADAAHVEQTLAGHRVVFLLERLQIQCPSRDRPGEAEQCVDLLTAEPKRPVLCRRQPLHVARRGKGMASISQRAGSRAAERRQPIEQLETHLQRQLLARECVDHGLEHRREPGWLHAPERVGEPPQLRIRCGRLVPIRQIDPKPEQPIDRRSHALPVQPRPGRGRCRHDQLRRRRRPCLPRRQFGRPSSHHDHTPVRRAIPTVDQIARTAPQRPHREIEAERRNGPRNERERGLAVNHVGIHRTERRGRRPVTAGLDTVDRRAFVLTYSCKATALLCCVSWEL